MRRNKRAVVLLSGGIDSATTLFYARSKGYKIKALLFDYGQRHNKEIKAAEKICVVCGVNLTLLSIRLPWGGSVLLDKKSKLPKQTSRNKNIPLTYVPGRNIIFLSFALSFAEAQKAEAIFIGANAVDFSGYPDCRYVFIKAFQRVADLGTKSGVEGKRIKIHAPLINLKKSEIIRLGLKLGVPFEYTWSCYKGERYPCGECDSCIIRKKGFKEAGFEDPVFNTDGHR